MHYIEDESFATDIERKGLNDGANGLSDRLCPVCELPLDPTHNKWNSNYKQMFADLEPKALIAQRKALKKEYPVSVGHHAVCYGELF